MCRNSKCLELSTDTPSTSTVSNCAASVGCDIRHQNGHIYCGPSNDRVLCNFSREECDSQPFCSLQTTPIVECVMLDLESYCHSASATDCLKKRPQCDYNAVTQQCERALCGFYPIQSLCTPSYCEWIAQNTTCQAKQDVCEGLPIYECDRSEKCGFDKTCGECAGVTHQVGCEVMVGCAWDKRSSECKKEFACAQLEGAGACKKHRECYYNEVTNVCVEPEGAPPCHSPYMTESACKRHPSCVFSSGRCTAKRHTESCNGLSPNKCRWNPKCRLDRQGSRCTRIDSCSRSTDQTHCLTSPEDCHWVQNLHTCTHISFGCEELAPQACNAKDGCAFWADRSQCLPTLGCARLSKEMCVGSAGKGKCQWAGEKCQKKANACSVVDFSIPTMCEKEGLSAYCEGVAPEWRRRSVMLESSARDGQLVFELDAGTIPLYAETKSFLCRPDTPCAICAPGYALNRFLEVGCDKEGDFVAIRGQICIRENTECRLTFEQCSESGGLYHPLTLIAAGASNLTPSWGMMLLLFALMT